MILRLYRDNRRVVNLAVGVGPDAYANKNGYQFNIIVGPRVPSVWARAGLDTWELAPSDVYKTDVFRGEMTPRRRRIRRRRGRK